MVNFPSLLLSISAHSLVFVVLLMSVQFKNNNETLKNNNETLNGYVINFQFTESNYIEEKRTKKITNEKLFKSKNFYKKKVTINKNNDSKISKVIDEYQINKQKLIAQTKVIKKEKNILKTKIMPKQKKIFKFEDKKITSNTLEKKTLFQPNFSEQRMSKFSFNTWTNNNVQLNKKSRYKSVRTCRYTKSEKSKNSPNNIKSKIFDNKKVTISELLGNNYYNPNLVNINHLLKVQQNQYENKTNITYLLDRNFRNRINCN